MTEDEARALRVGDRVITDYWKTTAISRLDIGPGATVWGEYEQGVGFGGAGSVEAHSAGLPVGSVAIRLDGHDYGADRNNKHRAHPSILSRAPFGRPPLHDPVALAEWLLS